MEISCFSQPNPHSWLGVEPELSRGRGGVGETSSQSPKCLGSTPRDDEQFCTWQQAAMSDCVGWVGKDLPLTLDRGSEVQ